MSGTDGSDKISDALGPLGDRLIDFVDAGLSSGDLKQSPELFFQWQAFDPKDTEVGPEIVQSSRLSTVRQTWTRAKLRVLTAAHSWPEYAASEAALPFEVGRTRSLTDWFTLNLANALLNDAARPSPALATLMDGAKKVVEGEPSRARATIDLDGVQVASPGLGITIGGTAISLRRPELSDIQPEMDEHTAMLEGHSIGLRPLAALATIEVDWTSPITLRVEVERLQSLLRLFAVSSARYIRVREELIAPVSESMGILRTGTGDHSYERTVIRPEHLQRLQSMASALWTNLPIGPAGPTEPEPTPVTTAFRRYCDALLRDGGLLERRFASAVMGLESLYLPAKQDGELSFRLRTSVGRVMGELGFDGDRVEAEVAYCYGVRSAYVHGGHLGGKLRKSGEKKFGHLPALLRRLLDYLRISIVVALVIPVSKDDFTKIINSAMVSSKGAASLAQLLQPTLNLVK